jgi:hypothetical protein
MEFKRRTNDSAISILELLHQRLARAQRQRRSIKTTHPPHPLFWKESLYRIQGVRRAVARDNP